MSAKRKLVLHLKRVHVRSDVKSDLGCENTQITYSQSRSLLFFLSPRSGCDRGLTFGRIYKEDGTLAVSVAQEGVVRLQPKQSTPSTAATVEQPKL